MSASVWARCRGSKRHLGWCASGGPAGDQSGQLDREGDTVRIDEAEVDAKLGALVQDEDLSRYIL
ncbi:hypothetical protein [Aquimonas voraii]|uniref:hypothetical protein n=1 Tax=Aquimonas voraii TaxID=265719 RepID=UPI00115FF1DE|nr:hypothetical protein [Aquimonas voraii]